MTWIEALRLFNALLASLIVFTLAFRGRMFWQDYDHSRRAAYMAFVLYALATAEFSAEAYFERIEIGAWSFFFLAANLTAAYALYRYKLLFGRKKTPAENFEGHM